jgi:hypothetical protein
MDLVFALIAIIVGAFILASIGAIVFWVTARTLQEQNE